VDQSLLYNSSSTSATSALTPVRSPRSHLVARAKLARLVDRAHTLAHLVDRAHTLARLLDRAHTLARLVDRAHTLARLVDHAHTNKSTAAATFFHMVRLLRYSRGIDSTSTGSADSADHSAPTKTGHSQSLRNSLSLRSSRYRLDSCQPVASQTCGTPQTHFAPREQIHHCSSEYIHHRRYVLKTLHIARLSRRRLDVPCASFECIAGRTCGLRRPTRHRLNDCRSRMLRDSLSIRRDTRNALPVQEHKLNPPSST